MAEALLWFWFTFFFFSILFIYLFFLLHISCCFAWLPCLAHPNIHLSFTPLPFPLHFQTHFPSHHRRHPRFLSRQQPQIDEEHGRCSPHAKQTPPIWPPTWQRTGTGAQCRYTPLTWSTGSPHPISMESDLSQIIQTKINTLINMACKWKGKTQRHFCDTICFPPPLGETIYFQGISLILRQIFYLRVKQLWILRKLVFSKVLKHLIHIILQIILLLNWHFYSSSLSKSS